MSVINLEEYRQPGRNFPDWLAAYIEYASFSEAPKRMHFWAGVSAVAGALRRQVWLNQGYFRWHVNHYIIFVAPPGIVSKSTTAAIAINLLRRVPGIKFGPDCVTWPALVTAFAESNESFQVGDDWHTQCAMTLESSEFGNLINPQDRDMVDLLVSLWDSKQGGFSKITKGSGSDTVENPWINLIACTTPSWIAGNFPEYVIGGGFTSRCLFIYAEKKDKLIAYPAFQMPKDMEVRQTALIEDLTAISKLTGPFHMTPEALVWGEAWYKNHYEHPPELLRDDRFGGYLARKQTHIHKLAMVLSAARGSDMVITEADLYLAAQALGELEEDMPKVFAKIGRSEESIQTERLITFIHRQGEVNYMQAYQYVHSAFPNVRDFEGIVQGALKAGLLALGNSASGLTLKTGPMVKK